MQKYDNEVHLTSTDRLLELMDAVMSIKMTIEDFRSDLKGLLGERDQVRERPAVMPYADAMRHTKLPSFSKFSLSNSLLKLSAMIAVHFEVYSHETCRCMTFKTGCTFIMTLVLS